MSLPEPRLVSEAGRAVLARAVSVDHDWALGASAVDVLFGAIEDLSDEDLAGADLLAYHLREAIACAQIHRDMQAADRRRRVDGAQPVCASLEQGCTADMGGPCKLDPLDGPEAGS
jgi:hypothetical protein